MKITISGTPGSGKSTVGKMLAKHLGYNYYYMGQMRRDIAKKKNMTLAEFNKLGETDPSTDNEVDEYQTELGKTKEDFVMEGRTSWYFIPDSVKVYIDVNPEVGAKRIFKQITDEGNDKRNEKMYNNEDEVLKANNERMQSDNLRYKKYYRIDCYNFKNYDIVVDSSDKTPKQVLKAVLLKLPKDL